MHDISHFFSGRYSKEFFVVFIEISPGGGRNPQNPQVFPANLTKVYHVALVIAFCFLSGNHSSIHKRHHPYKVQLHTEFISLTVYLHVLSGKVDPKIQIQSLSSQVKLVDETFLE